MKTIKFILVNIIPSGIIIGIICGLIVTFLVSTPIISLQNTSVRVEGEKIYFSFIFENKGENIAINTEFMIRYVILDDKNEIIYPYKVGEAEIFTQELEKYEVGDMFMHGHSIDFAPTEIGKDVFQNGGLIILSKVKYEDSCKCRYFINRLLGKQYSISRLMFYDVSEQGNALSPLKAEIRNKFKDMIDIWLEE